MADLSELADRAEKAEGPSRDIDRAIKHLVGHDWDYSADWDRWDALAGKKVSEPVAKPYTASLDAAMTLVPEGCGWDVFGGERPRQCASVWKVGAWSVEIEAATPALALCAAALRARGA